MSQWWWTDACVILNSEYMLLSLETSNKHATARMSSHQMTHVYCTVRHGRGWDQNNETGIATGR